MNKYISKIYWSFYPKVNEKVVYLQRYIYDFHLSDQVVKDDYGLTVKVIDYDSDEDLQQWCDVINNSYDDCFFDILKARVFFQKHIILTIARLSFFKRNLFLVQLLVGEYINPIRKLVEIFGLESEMNIKAMASEVCV